MPRRKPDPLLRSQIWEQSIKACADPKRAKHFLGLLEATSARPALAKYSAEPARILTALLSGSPSLSNLLLAHPDWLDRLRPEALKFPRRKRGLLSETSAWLQPLLKNGEHTRALSELRLFKAREMLRVGARDFARLAPIAETIGEISDVADVCLEIVWDLCHRQLGARFGQPSHLNPEGKGVATKGGVLGLGKLGGRELNYSSDVDVMFIYSEEGTVSPAMTNHQFFNRVAEAFIAEVSRMAPEGMLYRIDLRLRPEGDSGPLSRSLESFENYYSQWGQTWERMMLIKARGVAGDQALAAEFLEMIQPFRYPRSINESALKEVGRMKNRIETEVVKAGELERNVKLGRGGIREIEFIVQAQQLLHAGRQPFLQGAQTLGGLEKLAQYELLSPADSRALATAYAFLRDVEHRLQMEENLQTHTIPSARPARERLARLMGFANLRAFETALRGHTRTVRTIFDRLLHADETEHEPESPFPAQFTGAELEWKALLEEHGFKKPDDALRVLREFVEGPGFVHVSPRTTELAYKLLPKIFALCPRANPRLSDPDRVLTRLDAFITAYGTRSMLFELWHANPAIFEMLLLLFDRSEFLAELAIRTPDLVDSLVTSGRLRQRKSAEETLRDLRHGLGDADQHLWLRRYHQAELMRIGLRDLLGLADFEQHLVELSSLAEACLQYSLEVALRKHRLKTPPFAIIGLGKLGGAEIDYGSDLDLLFVADAATKYPARLAPIALAVMDLLSRRTEQGVVFHTDARLRPDGEKGLLVTTLKASEEYYLQRAQLWEIQSLTRARVVAGSQKIGRQFQQWAARLTDFQHRPAPASKRRSALTPIAFTSDWKARIHKMRLRIEKERTPAGKADLAIKTGAGGLMDAEFVAQIVCLENGWYEPNTLRALERARAAKLVPDADRLIAAYRELRRVEGILRRWSYEGETVLPDDPAPYFRVAVRCGFDNPEAFRQQLVRWRTAIRDVYSRFVSLP